MFDFIRKKKMIVRVIGFLFIFNTTLFAASASIEDDSGMSNRNMESQTVIKQEKVEVSLDSPSMIIMLILTSILGTFFVKDELGVST